MIDYSFLTIEMIMSDNLVPHQYAGQDVKLLYSKDNPAPLGYWLTNPYGHERVGLKDLIEYTSGKPYLANNPDNKDIAELIRSMPVAYYK